MSSNFFGGLESGIRFPATQINQGGPLPGAPYAGLDGRINATNSLLENVVPYAQEKAGAMGSDRNYQQIPHRMQHVVPMLFLPSADKKIGEPCKVSHPVDFGDVAFSLCSNNVMTLMCSSRRAMQVMRAPARNVFCNLCTVNYLLAGLQRLESNDTTSAWVNLANDMHYDYKSQDHLPALLKLLQTRILPYGIVQASEKQGGQHEATLAPVQAAANFVVTMTVDGQNRDLTNVWRDSHISAGDQLILVLEKRTTQRYVLNHYYKQMSQQTFPDQQECWQLIPRTFRMAEEGRYKAEQQNHDLDKYDYRCDGYWRLAQSFQHRAPMHDARNYADDTVFLRGQLLQVTFAPVWVQHDCADDSSVPSSRDTVSFQHSALIPSGRSNSSTVPLYQSQGPANPQQPRFVGSGRSGNKGDQERDKVPEAPVPDKGENLKNMSNRTNNNFSSKKTKLTQPASMAVRSATTDAATLLSTSMQPDLRRKTSLTAVVPATTSITSTASQPHALRQKEESSVTAAAAAQTISDAGHVKTVDAKAQSSTESKTSAIIREVLMPSNQVKAVVQTDGKAPVADRHAVKTAAVAEAPAEATSAKHVGTDAGAQQANKIKVVKRR